MSTIIRCYPGDRILDFLLVVSLVVLLVSSTAWLLSRPLRGKAALSHLVLYGALICSLASPALAWFCGAAGLTLFSIPLLCGAPARVTAAANPMELDLGCSSPQRATSRPAGVEAPVPRPIFAGCVDTSAASEENRSADPAAPAALEGERVGNSAETRLSFREIATGAMFVWGAGAFLGLARFAWKCGRVIQLRRAAFPLELEVHQALLREIAARLGMRRVPLLLGSKRAIAPLAVGFGRPAVILPQHLLGTVSDSELHDVLVHEAAHLRRGDQWIVLLQELAAALYWPIVSIHALNRGLQRAREEVCDNIVLADRDALRYSETLLHIAELLLRVYPMRAAVGIFDGPGKLERRIVGLIDPTRNPRTIPGRKAVCAVLVLFSALGMLASTTRFMGSARAASAAEEISTPSPVQEPRAAGRRRRRAIRREFPRTSGRARR
jgi:beta-lactamase regulating signal transducer with metallopeptidase domain